MRILLTGLTPEAKRVSLLIPLHNSAPYLEQLASDIARLTTPFFELLAYDDSSTDGSAEMAERLGFTVLRGTGMPRRQSFARNRLLECASGDYVHFHDHDDPIHPEFVEKMIKSAARGGLVICNFEQVGSLTGTHYHQFGERHAAAPYELVFDGYVHLNAMLVCRELALRSGGFDEQLTLCEEKDFLYKLLNAGAIVTFVFEKLAEWRIQQSSFMSQQGWMGAAAMLRRFLRNCAKNLHPAAKGAFLAYSLRSAWTYYCADQSTLSELSVMFHELSDYGLRPRSGLGTKIEWMVTAVGPMRHCRPAGYWRDGRDAA